MVPSYTIGCEQLLMVLELGRITHKKIGCNVTGKSFFDSLVVDERHGHLAEKRADVRPARLV